MTGTDWSRAIAALTPFVRGTTYELDGAEPGLLPGTIPLAGAAVADGGADAIVGLGVSDWLGDPIAQIRRHASALREGGTLALVPDRAGPPQGLVSLLGLAGGFEVVTSRRIDDGGHWLLVAERKAVAEVRGPLGTLGPRLAEAAGRDAAVLAELYFQVGTILLQAGDPGLACGCFAALQSLEGRSADGLFGLGMCHATRELWSEAVSDLRQAALLDPGNDQIRRWLELAESNLEAAPAGTAAAT